MHGSQPRETTPSPIQPRASDSKCPPGGLTRPRPAGLRMREQLDIPIRTRRRNDRRPRAPTRCRSNPTGGHRDDRSNSLGDPKWSLFETAGEPEERWINLSERWSIVSAMTEFVVTIIDPNVQPASGEEPTPEVRQIAWRGNADSRQHARDFADQMWEQTYGPGTQPANVQVSIVLADPVAQGAAEWLERFIGMYAGIDSGEGDPVHAVRVKARQLLEAGPTRDDPFTIAEEIAQALPGDGRAASLGGIWRDQLHRLES